MNTNAEAPPLLHGEDPIGKLHIQMSANRHRAIAGGAKTNALYQGGKPVGNPPRSQGASAVSKGAGMGIAVVEFE